MIVELLSYHLLLYCFTTFLFIGYLLELLLRLRWKLFKFKVYQYSSKSKILIICCLIYNIYFIAYKRELYSYVELLIFSLFLPCFLILLKQIKGYSKVEINKCLKDSESIGAYMAQQTFDAYYQIVLENIIDRMISFEKEHKIEFRIKKLVIVIPSSCNTENTLTSKDDRIEGFKTLEPVENDQGANVNRIYKNPVYRISLTEDIYIVAEFPSPLSALWKSQCDMEKEKWNYHRDCFIKTLKFLLRGSPCIVIEYDDTVDSPPSLSSHILSTLSK